MPTYTRSQQFVREFLKLAPEQRRLFLAAVQEMLDDLRAKQVFRPSLRVKGVQGHPGVFEMTWDFHDGRATFEYGVERRPGEQHIHWRRIGGHEIFQHP